MCLNHGLSALRPLADGASGAQVTINASSIRYAKRLAHGNNMAVTFVCCTLAAVWDIFPCTLHIAHCTTAVLEPSTSTPKLKASGGKTTYLYPARKDK